MQLCDPEWLQPHSQPTTMVHAWMGLAWECHAFFGRRRQTRRRRHRAAVYDVVSRVASFSLSIDPLFSLLCSVLLGGAPSMAAIGLRPSCLPSGPNVAGLASTMHVGTDRL